MATARRIGGENSATRERILEATEQLIREQGYASASTRRVAAHAGLKPSLVHYYFPTTDDLLVAVSKRGAKESDRMIEEALKSDRPLRALWEFFSDTSRTRLVLEFMAMANHRDAVRKHMAEHSEEMRQRQAEILEKLIGTKFSLPDGCPPAGLSVLLAGIGRVLIMEGGLGVTGGHEEAREFVERWLDMLEPADVEKAES
ncbi:MAG: TetR/AcrR family transcriptional regulator [Novosphingobium sp.]|nr:TetR/AcrR family transcriptional regulator [Novosphingobium sp.]